MRKSCSTKNIVIAKHKAKKEEIKLLKGEAGTSQGRITIEQFWNKYLLYAKATKRPKTVDNDIRFWSRFSKWMKCKGLKYLDHISPQTFEAYRLYLLDLGLRKVSVNIIHRHISSIFSFASRHGFVENNPIQKIKKYKIAEKAPRYLTKEETQKLLIEAENHSKEMHLIFAMGIYAGFRRSEIANARWEWFDFDNDIIVIQPHGHFIPKSHRMRPIPLHKTLKNILLKYEAFEGFLLNSNIQEDQRKNLLRYDFKNSFRTVRNRVGLEWVTPHTLRHTFASQLAKAGVSLYKIQQWLGHSDPRTTMIYAHLQAQDDEINLI